MKEGGNEFQMLNRGTFQCCGEPAQENVGAAAVPQAEAGPSALLIDAAEENRKLFIFSKSQRRRRKDLRDDTRDARSRHGLASDHSRESKE